MKDRANTLPQEFLSTTRALMGDDCFARFLAAFDEEPPVSIRLNPQLSGQPNGTLDPSRNLNSQLNPVPWCLTGFYLEHRPNFTCDPLLHAGCYYVQEAASMFLYEVLRQHLPAHPVAMLDLCAAPGGKSTLARTILPEGSVLFSNEPVRSRANILLENITKWGWTDCHVTCCYPRDYRKSKMHFDVILCDVPCSGEGMFRKDPATIGEWSPQNVERCWRLQRKIVSDAWACLNDGGLLIYSTCTFNTKENEENVSWILEIFDADILPVQTQPEWGITGSLLPAFDAPVYRFIPGITRSEGLFMCVMRKKGSKDEGVRLKMKNISLHLPLSTFLLSPPTLHTDGPRVELTYQQAIAYLRHEALVLPPDTPRGLVEVSFMGHGLGMVKNLGTRANNLYPKEWRIKTTHIPQEYESIIGVSPNNI